MQTYPNRRRAVALVLALALCYLVAAFGAQFAPGAWYASLAKPAWTPPPWVFAPVWSTLYTLMAVAAWLVWLRVGIRSWALALFGAQLLLNALWSWLFFGLQRPVFGLVNLLVLLLLLAATTIAFFRVRPSAGWLLVPYLLWSGYAFTLNAGIVVLN